MDYFTLTALPNTHLWRKPPARDTSTAPIVYTALRHPFVLAEVTVSADWEMEWDQGGLVIFAGDLPDPTPSPERVHSRLHRSSGHPSCKWVKAGLEFSAGTVNASSVCATSDGSDWSLTPLGFPDVPSSIYSLRIKLERIGHSLWVWYQLPRSSPYNVSPGGIGGSWRKLREVTGFFYEIEDKSVRLGVYASRPANFQLSSAWESTQGGGETSMGLVVEFEDLEIF